MSLTKSISRLLWAPLCLMPAWAFEPGNLRYEYPCKVTTEDRAEFATVAYDDRGWPEWKTFLGRNYQVQHLIPPGGILWNRIRVRIGPETKGKDLVIAIEDGQVLDAVFFNGQPLLSCWQSKNVQFPLRRVSFAVPAELVRYDGDNLLSLRYYNFPQPREDTLGRVELREAEPTDRLQIGGCTQPWIAARTQTVDFSISSGLPRAQIARVVWRIEDYFGAALTTGSTAVVLAPAGKPDGKTILRIPLNGNNRAYKGVAWLQGDGRQGPETWSYVGQWPNVATEYRQTVRLFNGWTFAMAPGVQEFNPAHLPAASEWKPTTMPHELWNTQKAHRMWYRHRLAVPAGMTGKRITLAFFEVGQQVEVFVDGKFVGRKTSWEVPGEFELTGLVTPGGTHELLLGVTDYIVALKPEARAKVVDGADIIPGQSVIGPVSVLSPGNRHHGIGCVPELRTTPQDLRLEWVGVESQADAPRQVKRLKILATVAGAAAADKPVRLQAEVRFKGKSIRTFPAATATIAAHRMTAVVLDAAFPEGEYWTLNTPTLYRLAARLLDNERVADEVDVRFGFRQFEAQGRFIAMNGLPLRAMGSDFWVPNTSPRGPETLDMCRAQPTRDVSFTHAVGGGYFDVLDEAGGLAFADNLEVMANTRGMYAVEDPRFYDNVVSKFRHLIPALHHHPSIMIWDWGNELPYYVRKTVSDNGVKMGCQAVAKIQQLDPSRFSIASALGDGRGFAAMPLLPTHSGVIGPGGVPNAFWYYAGAEKTPAYLRALFARDTVSFSWLAEQDRQRPRFWPGAKPLYHSELGHWGRVNQSVETGDQLYCAVPEFRKFVLSPWGGSAPFWVSPGAWYANEAARGDFYRLTQTWLRGLYGANHVATRAAEEKLARAAVFPKYWENKYFGGETVAYPIFAVNNYLWPETVQLDWALYAENGHKLSGGAKSWKLAGGTLQEDQLMLHFPEVKEAVYVRLIYTVTSQTLGLEYRGWERLTAFPKRDLKQASAGLTVALYDPADRTAAVLKKAGVVFTRLNAITNVDFSAYRLLLIGENGADETLVNARAALQAAVERGLTCAVLLQEYGRIKNIFPVIIAEHGGYATEAYLANPRHALARALLPDDFRYWRNPDHDHLVYINGMSFPATANVRNIAGGCLAEIPAGRGRYVLCQMPLIRDLDVEPAAQQLVANLLDSVKTPPPNFPGRKLVAFDADRDFVNSWATKVGLEAGAFPVAKPEQAVLLTTGATLVRADPAALKAFLEQGGTVWVNGVESNALPWFDQNMQIALELTPNPKRYTILKRRDKLLDGIANAALTWHGDFAGVGAAQKAPTADDLGHYEIALAGEDTSRLLAPSYLIKRQFGRGLLVLDNLRWPQSTLAKAQYCFAQLAYNLELREMREPARRNKRQTDFAALYRFTPLDIGPAANRGLADEKAGDGQGGWSDQGPENDLRHLPVGTNLYCLGVPVRILDPAQHGGKGCIALAGGAGGELPREVKGIKVGFKADVLFFFHSAAWGPQGECFRYRIWYDDRKTWIPDGTILSKAGPEVDVPVRADTEIADWWRAGAMVKEETSLPNAELAWAGKNGMAVVGFYMQTWKNPHPEKTIETIDIISTGKSGQYFILGLTAGKHK